MKDLWERLRVCTGFDWDEYNAGKNWAKHVVGPLECEQVFGNQPLVLAADTAHSQVEDRYYGLGKTNAGRRLFVVFTLRHPLVRVISARDMSRKEREVYENYEAP